MTLLVLALCLMLLSAMGAVCLSRCERLGAWIAAAGMASASVLGLVACADVLVQTKTVSLRLPWAVPMGSFYLEADPLSALFLAPILLLAALGAVYGYEYMAKGKGRALAGGLFNLLAASMTLVLLARNGILFLTAWELMTISSFFLVTWNGESASVRRAGLTYLVAAHVGTAFLLAVFARLGAGAPSLDFDCLARPQDPAAALCLFVMILIGFGVKAGIFPLHTWLPQAHPAAPSHVSALMSGGLIKTGVYGILRLITIIGPAPASWGWVLLIAGFATAILGVLHALAQRDLKRLLAYSSIENMGLAFLGLGLGLIGAAWKFPLMAVLGVGGALVHVFNHALFKGLLFLGAGSLIHSAGTAQIDRLGGCFRRMPMTGLAFLTGAMSICGLPFLNGFTGEFLIYLAAFSALNPASPAAGAAITAIAGLALTGGLALACFSQTFGVLFLGERRSPASQAAHDPGRAMLAPMLLLASACLLAPMVLPLLLGPLGRAVAPVMGLDPSSFSMGPATRVLWWGSTGFLGLWMLLASLVAKVRARALAARTVEAGITWDCGYAAPGPRAQYTAASFSSPLRASFASLLRTRTHARLPGALFPAHPGQFDSRASDIVDAACVEPGFTALKALLARVHWFQHGRLHVYILYIALTLLGLLVWSIF